MFTTRSGHTRGTAKEKLAEGVWSGEVPAPFDLKTGPITRPPGIPKDPSPTTSLYHDNETYMRGTTRPQHSRYQLPPPIAPSPKIGNGWSCLEENDTPRYADIKWSIGDIYSELDVFLFEDCKFDSIESYWQAISMHIYNSPKYWMWVKAQHLELLQRVLSNPKDFRHEHYKKLNSQFRRMPPECLCHVAPFSQREMIPANLWQTLLVPRQFVNHFMLQVTADLYSIYLVLFLHTNLDEDYVDYIPDCAARGDWNDRHCALRLNSNLTYEPMIPDSESVSTYCLPRVTFEKYPTGDLKFMEKDDKYHPFLCDFDGVPAPEPLPPKVVIVPINEKYVERVLWASFEKPKDNMNGNKERFKRRRVTGSSTVTGLYAQNKRGEPHHKYGLSTKSRRNSEAKSTTNPR